MVGGYNTGAAGTLELEEYLSLSLSLRSTRRAKLFARIST